MNKIEVNTAFYHVLLWEHHDKLLHKGMLHLCMRSPCQKEIKKIILANKKSITSKKALESMCEEEFPSGASVRMCFEAGDGRHVCEEGYVKSREGEDTYFVVSAHRGRQFSITSSDMVKINT